MAYVIEADLRVASLAEYASGLALTTTEAPAASCTAAISGISQRIDDYCNDHFESEVLTLDIDGSDMTRLFLPRRCTALTSVSIRDEDGTLTAQTASVYRLHSSLLSGGARRYGEFDWIEVVPNSSGLTGLPSGSGDGYVWPLGPQTVRVVGTFGWSATPRDIKRASALLVYDHFKPQRADLRRAQGWRTADADFDLAATTPTGIAEVDSIIADYTHESNLAVA